MDLVKNTLAEQIYQILRNDILTLRSPLGEKLTLKAMQERFGVSSTPIRDAFTRLTDDGLVNYYSNIGVNVINLTTEDLTELYQFMGDLDSLALTYCASWPNQQEVLAAFEKLLKETEALEQLLHTFPDNPEYSRRWISCSDEFHLIFYNYCQNSRLTRAAEKQRSQLTIFSNMYEADPDVQKLIAKWHRSIYDSYKSGHIEDAARKMKAHLEESLTYALKFLNYKLS